MLPLGHLSLGYLVYVGVSRLFHWRPPDAATLSVLVVATQLPDGIDKPLSWGLGLLPTGRSLGHSALTLLFISAVALRLTRLLGRPALGRALALGYASHLLGDLYAAATSDAESLLFVFWPLVPQEPYTTPPRLDIIVDVAFHSFPLLGYLAAYGFFAAVVSRLVRGTDWLYAVSVLLPPAVTAGVFLAWGSSLSGYAVELVLAQIAVAVWIRDGAPGLPRRWN